MVEDKRTLDLYSNSDTNLPPGYEEKERFWGPIKKNPDIFEKENEEKNWRWELEKEFPFFVWRQDK